MEKKTRIRGKVKQSSIGLRTQAERYRIRDAREMFFKAKTKSRCKRSKRKKSKAKRRVWSDRERAEFARAYYEKNFGEEVEWEDKQVIMGHHKLDERDRLDKTIPFTPPSVKELGAYMYLEEQNRKNLRMFDLD